MPDLNSDGVIDIADLIESIKLLSPLEPKGPNPADGTTIVSPGTSLDWQDAERAQTYNVYL
jgi:hypothetical protein